MSLNSKSPCCELRHAFRRFPQLLRGYFLPLLFFAPPDFAAGSADGLAACFVAGLAADLAPAALAAGLPDLAAAVGSACFAGAACAFSPLFPFFSFFFGASLMPESLRRIFSRSSGVLPRP